MNNKKKLIIFTGFVLMPLLISGSANAAIFKCVSPTGNTFYLDKPCPVVAKETKMKAVKDPKNGYIPPVLVNKRDDENYSKDTAVTDGSESQSGAKKLKKLSGTANTGGNDSEGFEKKKSVAKAKNKEADSRLLNGGDSPSETATASGDPEIEPLRMNNY